MSGLIFALIVIAVFWALAYFAAPLWLWTGAVALAWCRWLALPTRRPRSPGSCSGAGGAAQRPSAAPYARHRPSAWVGSAKCCHPSPRPSASPSTPATPGGMRTCSPGAPTGRSSWPRRPPNLSDEEQAFLDGPVEEFCKSLDDWQITHELYDLPPAAWELIRKHRFFGMIIPKQYGGLASRPSPTPRW